MGFLNPLEHAVGGCWPGLDRISPCLYLGCCSFDPLAGFLQLAGSFLCFRVFVVVFSGSLCILKAVFSCGGFHPGVAVVQLHKEKNGLG